MTTSDALQTLVELPGIGPWSAGLVLLRGFGRLDVFPPALQDAHRRLQKLRAWSADQPCTWTPVSSTSVAVE